MSARKPVPATAKIVAAASADDNSQPAAPAAPVADAPSGSTDGTNAPADAASPDDTALEAPSEGSAAEGDLVEVRVLSAIDGFEPNDVALLTYAEVRALGHSVDADPDAVAYAKSLDA